MLLLELLSQFNTQTIAGRGYINSKTLGIITGDSFAPHAMLIAEHGAQMGIDRQWLKNNIPQDRGRWGIWAEDNDYLFGPVQNAAYANHWVRFHNQTAGRSRMDINLTGVLSDVQDIIVNPSFGGWVIQLLRKKYKVSVDIDYTNSANIEGQNRSGGVTDMFTTPVEFNAFKRNFAPGKIVEAITKK